MQRSSVVHSFTVLWQQKRFLTNYLDNEQATVKIHCKTFDHFYSSISQVQVRMWLFQYHHHNQGTKTDMEKNTYIYIFIDLS